MLPYLPFLDAPQVLSMGLKALDLRDWVEIDDQFAAQLAERRRLLTENRDQVLAALPEAADGQREVLALMLDHLPAASLSAIGASPARSPIWRPASASSSTISRIARSSSPGGWCRRICA